MRARLRRLGFCYFALLCHNLHTKFSTPFTGVTIHMFHSLALRLHYQSERSSSTATTTTMQKTTKWQKKSFESSRSLASSFFPPLPPSSSCRAHSTGLSDGRALNLFCFENKNVELEFALNLRPSQGFGRLMWLCMRFSLCATCLCCALSGRRTRTQRIYILLILRTRSSSQCFPI